MAEDIAVSVEQLKQFRQLVNANYLNATRLQARLQSMVGSNELQNDDDDKCFQTDILAQMTTEEVDSLQSRLNNTKLIRTQLDWTHISSALMHELDEKISFFMINIVKKLNISTIGLSEAMEKKLGKRMSKREINYFRTLIQRAIQNTKAASSAANIFKKQHDAPQEDDLDGLSENVLIDIFNAYRIYKFSNFQFEPYTAEQFTKAIQTNSFLKQNKGEIANIFNAKYDRHMPFQLYPSWLVADDQFIIFNFFFASSYFVHKLRTNPARAQSKFSIYVIPKSIVSIYDENMVFSGTIALDVSTFLTQNGFQSFSRTAINESDAQNPNKLYQIIEYQLNGPNAEYLQQDVLLIVDRRQTQNILYVLNASAHHEKLKQLQQNHLLGMEFDILARDGPTSVVQCYFCKGIGEKARFYPEYLTFLMCRLFKRNISLSDFEYAQSVYASSYRHAFGVDLEDLNFNKYHKLILNSMHISVNYDRNYVASELTHDDAGTDAGDTKEEDSGDTLDEFGLENEWTQQCNVKDTQPPSDCPYIEFIMKELRKFAQVAEYQIDSTNSDTFNPFLLSVALDHLICVHSFSSTEDDQQIKTFVQNKNGSCPHGKDCVVLRQFSHRRREREARNGDDNGTRGTVQRIKGGKASQIHIIVDCLSTLHCSLQHPFTITIGDIDKCNNKFGTIVQKTKTSGHGHDDIAAIDFGVSIHEWLDFDESPKYKSFRDEIIHGSASTIDETLYNMYKSICLLLVPVFLNKFGVLELMSIKLYTDTSELCKAFRMAFWKRKGKEKKIEFYWWALTLFKTMLYHSKPLNRVSPKSRNPMTIYHGLSAVFVLDDSCPFYNGPISTTRDLMVAHRFSDGKGLRWNICPSYSNPFKYVYGLEVHRISCFSDEREVLLCNSHLPISSTKNYEDDERTLMIDLFMKQIMMYKQKEINASDFYRKIGFKYQRSWIESIKTHPLLYQPLVINKNERVIHKLRSVFKIKELDGPYTLLSTKFEQNQAFKRFGAAFKLNISDQNVAYFQNAQYKVIFGDKQSKEMRYDEAFQLCQNNASATVLVSNEEIFESKSEFELQQISVTTEQNKTAASFMYCDEDKQLITFKEGEIASTQKDILESILNAKYQIKYSNVLQSTSNDATAPCGAEYKCAPLDTFALPVQVPNNVRDLYQMDVMVAPLVGKTVKKNAQGKWLKYQSNLDANGLFYGLGSNFGETQYSNAAEQGKIKIISSESLAQKRSCLVDRKSVSFVVKGKGKKDPPFFYVNIGKYGLKPTRYTLRNSDKDSGYLTNWCLLASNNGVEWITLRQHINDSVLKQEGPFETAVWSINGDDYKKDDGYFSYFKVLMTATNHAGEWKFGCSGFELYGHLIDGFQHVYDSMAFFKSYVPNKFRINAANSPLQIDYPLTVSKFDSNTRYSGSIEIHSASAIIIQKNGAINANDCGLPPAFCNYESDFDENGVFYAIGTQFGTQKYENPALAGLVKVSGAADKVVSALIGRENKQAYTTEKFFTVDLVKYQVRPVAYTMKSSEWPNAGLKDWNLEGSHDGKRWICLKKHKSDDSQITAYASKTWAVDDITQFYRFFRVMMTGTAHCNKWVVCSSGMELYGDLECCNSDSVEAKQDAWSTDGDNAYFSGTRGGRIVLSSHASVTNYGDITANGTNEKMFGSIDIKCKTFRNFGRIECKKRGEITIECDAFEASDESIMNPKAIVKTSNPELNAAGHVAKVINSAV